MSKKWRGAALGDIAAKLVDGSHNPPEKQLSGRPMLSARNIENSRIVWDEHRLISDAAFVTEDARTRIRPGDVLLTIVGSIGRSTCVTDAMPRFALQRSVAVISVPEVLPQFLSYQFQSPRFQAHLAGAARGTAQKGVYLGTLAVSEVQIAPLPEQHRIVEAIESYFTRLDDAVATLERVQRNLKRYRASVLKAAVEGRLVPTEAELARAERRDYEPAPVLLERILAERRRRWEASGRKGKYEEPLAPDSTELPELPEGWCWASVDQLANVVRGASPRPAGDPRYFGGHIPWITVGDLTRDGSPYLRAVPGSVTASGRDASRYIAPDTLLLTNSGVTLGVPKITLIGGCINDGSVALLNIEYPLKLYLLYFLHSQTVALRAINQGAAQPNLNTSIVKAIRVPVPPRAEQTRIAARLEDLLSVASKVVEDVQRNSGRAARLRQSILKWVFEGKLADQDPNDEPASILLERIEAERAAGPPTKKNRRSNGRVRKTA